MWGTQGQGVKGAREVGERGEEGRIATYDAREKGGKCVCEGERLGESKEGWRRRKESPEGRNGVSQGRTRRRRMEIKRWVRKHKLEAAPGYVLRIGKNKHKR